MAVSCIQDVPCEHGAYHAQEPLAIDRLVDETIGAGRFDELMRRALHVRGDDNHARGGVELPELGQHVEPVHAFHDQVEQDGVRLLEEIPLEGRHAVLGFHHLEAVGLEHRAHAAPGQTGIVDEKDLLLHTCSRMASAI